jgi:aspartyl-tRNA synthetase
MATRPSSSPAIRRNSYKFAGDARTRLGEELNLVDRDRFELCWIVDFPFYEWNEDEKKIDFAHNPFSMPQGGIDALNGQDPLTIKAFQYDMVCNGFEIASGGIRNHLPETMVKAFEIGRPDARRWRSASAASIARSSTARRRMAAWRPASTAS